MFLDGVFLFAVVGFFQKDFLAKALDTKTWRVNTNFDNPVNWEDGRVPCSKDRVIFPADSPIIVFMPDKFSVSEMVLPQNGELVFPNNGVIDTSIGPSREFCVGKDVKFHVRADSWYDPRNWNITSARAFPRGVSRHNAAVPHAYQVPCATDVVQFPADVSFQVHDITPDTEVSVLRINDRDYGQFEFSNLMSTPTGKMLFPGNPQIKFTHATCTDESGCVCGNEEYRIFRHICKFEDSLCPEVNCYDPIEVTGHCCPFCGAKIIAKHDNGFKMEELLRLHEKFHQQADFKNVESFTTKTSSGDIQSIFVDHTGTNKYANQLAQRLHSLLRKDADGSRLYKIQSVEIYQSTRFNPDASGYSDNQSGLSSGGVAAIVIVLLSFGFALAVYFYKKRQIQGFSFARFDLGSDRIELELGTTPHDELQPGDSTSSPSVQQENISKGFDNPIYGKNVSEQAPSFVEELSDAKNFVENPMFQILGDSSDDKDEN